jgi:signal peptidase I
MDDRTPQTPPDRTHSYHAETWNAPVQQREHALSLRSTVRELIETVIFVLLTFFVFQGMIQTFRIEGQSMEPNFHTRQYILVNKIVYFHFDANAPLRLLPGHEALPQKVIYPFRMPERGDVVVLEAPTTGSDQRPEDYIKRVIGLPGETIQIRDGRVYINGKPLQEDLQDGGYLMDTTDCLGSSLCQPYTIPEGHVVVLGDNRNNSQDSRAWGAEAALPLDRVVGKAWLSYWPQPYWGIVDTPTYAQTP